MLAPDTVLQDRYRIVRKLGQGGMGAVYEALDLRLDTTVALKETFFVDDRLRKQFEREARLLARLHHPALPRVSDHFSELKGQFLVMQFIKGEDLYEKIEHRRGPFPPDQVTSWADQLLDALDYLHTQEPQIVHRDIKPQNLKVTPRGQIILLDFGLAKGQGSEVSRVTTSASIFGYTPNYAPLEQIQGLGTDPRSDLYSLAATLYHLITGEKPPDALTRAAAIVNSQPDPLQPANEINNGVSAETAWVLQRALAQNRDQRYATAAEMRRALGSTSDAVTISNRSEADTVLFPMPLKQSLGTTQAGLKNPTAVAGETTMVRGSTTALRPTMLSPWAMLAVAVIVLVVGVGGFYAYQLSDRQQTEPATQEFKPAESPTSSEVVTPADSNGEAGSTANTNAETSESPSPAGQTASTSEKSSRERTTKKKSSAATAESEEHEDWDVVITPQPPPASWRPSVPGTRPPKHPGPTIRTFRDGTQLITSPDGTRIVITPDGKRRVFRPGQKIDREIPEPSPEKSRP